jgi:hypothetical protein
MMILDIPHHLIITLGPNPQSPITNPQPRKYTMRTPAHATTQVRATLPNLLQAGWVRRVLAITGATALLALWTWSIRSSRVDWDPPFTGLDSLSFNPYWLGVSALELALPV